MMKTTRTILARAAAVLALAVLLPLWGLGGHAWAEDKSKCIVVWLNDGGRTEVLFTDMPEFTYADGNVTLKSTTTELSWPIANLQRFTFEDVIVTGIKDLTGLDLLADDCAAYDLSGRLVKQGVKSLAELPAGTYIVKTGSVTVKVVRN